MSEHRALTEQEITDACRHMREQLAAPFIDDDGKMGIMARTKKTKAKRAPSLYRIAKGLRIRAQAFRNEKRDPYNINFCVAVTLETIATEIDGGRS